MTSNCFMNDESWLAFVNYYTDRIGRKPKCVETVVKEVIESIKEAFVRNGEYRYWRQELNNNFLRKVVWEEIGESFRYMLGCYRYWDVYFFEGLAVNEMTNRAFIPRHQLMRIKARDIMDNLCRGLLWERELVDENATTRTIYHCGIKNWNMMFNQLNQHLSEDEIRHSIEMDEECDPLVVKRFGTWQLFRAMLKDCEEVGFEVAEFYGAKGRFMDIAKEVYAKIKAELNAPKRTKLAKEELVGLLLEGIEALFKKQKELS